MHKDIYYQGINLSAYRTCHSLFERFRKSSAAGEKGFYFSLNQDLFVETFYKNEFVLTPGLTHSKWFNGKMQDRLEEEERCRLPSEEKLAKRQQNWAESSKDYCYVKLHGSYGWKT